MDRCSVASVRARLTSVGWCVGLGGSGGSYLLFQLTGAPGTSFTTFAVGFVLGSVIGIPRALVLGIELDASGLTIRNYFRTYVIPWSDVDLVGWERTWHGGYPGGGFVIPALAVRLRSGRSIIVRASWGMFSQSRERLLAAVQKHAREQGIRVEVTADDLHFGWRGAKHTHWTVSELTRGFK
jgi:hypothetical protein